MFDFIHNLPELYKGIFFIIFSTIVLLWLLGILTYLLIVMIKK